MKLLEAWKAKTPKERWIDQQICYENQVAKMHNDLIGGCRSGKKPTRDRLAGAYDLVMTRYTQLQILLRKYRVVIADQEAPDAVG